MESKNNKLRTINPATYTEASTSPETPSLSTEISSLSPTLPTESPSPSLKDYLMILNIPENYIDHRFSRNWDKCKPNACLVEYSHIIGINVSDYQHS